MCITIQTAILSLLSPPIAVALNTVARTNGGEKGQQKYDKCLLKVIGFRFTKIPTYIPPLRLETRQKQLGSARPEQIS